MGFSKYLLFAVFTFLLVSASSAEPPQSHRRLLVPDADVQPVVEDEELVLPTRLKKTISSSFTTDKPIKFSTISSSSTKNKTKLIKPFSASGSGSLKSKAKSISSDSSDLLLTSDADAAVAKTKLNSTSKSSSVSAKKSPDLLKISSSPKNKTSKSSSAYDNTELAIKKKKKELGNEINAKSASATATKDKKKNATEIHNQIQNPKKNPIAATSTKKQPIYNTENDDLVSDLADLPAKFQQTIIPDLKRISSSSQVYFSKANKEFTKGFKPYVSTKFAATAATAISLAFITIPFLLVSLLFNQIKAYFSLQRLLIFIQVYLAIYFSILCLSSLVTGLEPLRFFYATSQSTYVWVQVLQTLGYVIFLLLLLMYLVLVFSTDTGPRIKLLGLAQTLLGLAVGLHYYMTVFHRMVLRQPPKASWKVHAIYATCFLVICLLAGADGRKKAYLGEGGEDGKKS